MDLILKIHYTRSFKKSYNQGTFAQQKVIVMRIKKSYIKTIFNLYNFCVIHHIFINLPSEEFSNHKIFLSPFLQKQ